MMGSNYRALAIWADLLYSVGDLYILLPELVSPLAVALLFCNYASGEGRLLHSHGLSRVCEMTCSP